MLRLCSRLYMPNVRYVAPCALGARVVFRAREDVLRCRMIFGRGRDAHLVLLLLPCPGYNAQGLKYVRIATGLVCDSVITCRGGALWPRTAE